jgi:integration host factor subunit beta
VVKSELIDAFVAENPTLRRSEIEDAVDAILQAMTAALAEGRRIELRGFGGFSASIRPAYCGRNPSTGAPVDVPARSTIAFRPGAPLRARLNPHLKPD